VFRQRDSWICIGTGEITISCTQLAPNFTTFLQHSTESKLRLLHIVQNKDMGQLADWIKHGQAIIVSDGSYKNSIGIAAVILEGPDKSCCLTFQATAPGSESDMTPFCSELTGILAGLLMIAKMVEFFNISSGDITLACDGLSALQQCNKETMHLHPDMACYDLIRAIRHLRHRSPLK
jgi:hypothetical protein